MKRKATKEVKVGNLGIGGDNPVRVQSMTSTRTEDVDATARQIERLLDEGCEIIRIAVPNKKALEGFRELRKLFPQVCRHSLQSRSGHTGHRGWNRQGTDKPR